jgi:hypothetical protein
MATLNEDARPGRIASSRLGRACVGAAAGSCGGAVVALVIFAAVWLNLGLLRPAVPGSVAVVLLVALAGSLGGALLRPTGTTAVQQRTKPAPLAGLIVWALAGAGIGGVGAILNGLGSVKDGALYGAVFGSLLAATGASICMAGSGRLAALGSTSLAALLGAGLGMVGGVLAAAAFGAREGPGLLCAGVCCGAAFAVIGWWTATRCVASARLARQE